MSGSARGQAMAESILVLMLLGLLLVGVERIAAVQHARHVANAASRLLADLAAIHSDRGQDAALAPGEITAATRRALPIAWRDGVVLTLATQAVPGEDFLAAAPVARPVAVAFGLHAPAAIAAHVAYRDPHAPRPRGRFDLLSPPTAHGHTVLLHDDWMARDAAAAAHRLAHPLVYPREGGMALAATVAASLPATEHLKLMPPKFGALRDWSEL